MTKVFSSIDDFKSAVGDEVGVSDWHTVDQPQIDLFAEATLDPQWIHIDPVKAAAGPYGTTIAHGYLTLSLLAPLMKSTYRVEGATRAVNYGLNKVRFAAPVPVNSRVRVRVALQSVDDVPGGVQAVWKSTIELEGSEKPACIAEPVVRIYF
ncbi:MaoC family dehydratase [soil metagenome]